MPQYYIEKALLLLGALSTQKQDVPRSHMTQGQWHAAQRNLSSADIFSAYALKQAVIEFLDGSTGWSIYSTRRIVWFAPVWVLLESVNQGTGLDDLLIASRQPVIRTIRAIGEITFIVWRALLLTSCSVLTQEKGTEGIFGYPLGAEEMRNSRMSGTFMPTASAASFQITD